MFYAYPNPHPNPNSDPNPNLDPNQAWEELARACGGPRCLLDGVELLLRRGVELVEDKTAESAVESQDAIDRLQVDYLTPFLQNVNDLNAISYEEAQRARDSCLKSLKERLIERANIMMARLTEENSKLAKKQAAYQRNARDRDAVAEEEFERFCSEAMFRVQILEQRLAAHEETALKKFQDLDAKLADDPRMRALQE